MTLTGDGWQITWAGSELIARPTTDPAIDAEARGAYEDRLRELQAEIEEADAGNDVERLDRARQAVTWRIRAAVRKIAAEMPTCGSEIPLTFEYRWY
jgi:hypothetical protein